ncbi:MAG: hypothetical protein KDD00_12720 [Ignavibacteriae bacterium]|nr:hypothetical protein [Ignavibacteriota bacterium]
MKKQFCFLLFLIYFFPYGYIFSGIPEYVLTAKNFELFPNNELTFEIRLQSANATVLEYAGGEYFLYFNPDIANGGVLTVEITDSDLPSDLVPVNPEIISSQGFPVVLKLGLNTFPGSGNGYLISNLFPGKLIAKVKLRTSASSMKFRNVHLGTEFFINPGWKNSPVNQSTNIFAYVESEVTKISDPESNKIECGFFQYCGTVLQLRLLEEGLYNSVTDTYNRKDSIRLYLRDISPPYSLIDSSKGVIDTIDLFGTFYFPNALSGVYYTVMKHLNSLETWGIDTINRNNCNGQGEWFTNTSDYSVTPSKVFGNNLILKGSEYCIYSGDVDQNRQIDGTDLIKIHNDFQNFITGNVNTDINGDNIVDLQDLLITKTNSDNFVLAILPP